MPLLLLQKRQCTQHDREFCTSPVGAVHLRTGKQTLQLDPFTFDGYKRRWLLHLSRSCQS